MQIEVDRAAAAPTLADRAWRLGLFVAYRLLRIWWFLRRPATRGAFVAVWHDDALLVIRNTYKAGETLPCGRVDRGETAREAARRELGEEVGIEVDEDTLVFALDFPIDFEHKRERATVFELRPAERPEARIDRREVLAASYVPRGQLGAHPLAPHVRHYLRWLDEGGPSGTEPR